MNEPFDDIRERLTELRADPGGDPAPVLAAGLRARRRRAVVGGGVGALALAGVMSAGVLVAPWEDDGTAQVIAADGPPDDQPIQKGPPPVPSPALDLWDDFPVDADPRPVVLTGITAGVGIASFPTDELEAAFYGGRWDVQAELPGAPEQIDGFPMIEAKSALERLRRDATSDDHAGTERVTLTRVYLGTASFFTDRGERQLPAWRFSFAEANFDHAMVLAIAEPAIFSIERGLGRARGPRPDRARLAADGRTLTVHFTGAEAGTGPCQAEYDASVSGTPQAVLIDIVQAPREPRSGPPAICADIGHGRSLTVDLGNRLGARAVIDAFGGAIPVKAAR